MIGPTQQVGTTTRPRARSTTDEVERVVETSPHDDVTQATDAEEAAALAAALDEADDEASAEVMHLRSEGVPLALLADLADPSGPASPSILEDEGLPDVAWWGDKERQESIDDEADDEA